MTVPKHRDITDFLALEAEAEAETGMSRDTKTVIKLVDEFWAETAPGRP